MNDPLGQTAINCQNAGKGFSLQDFNFKDMAVWFLILRQKVTFISLYKHSCTFMAGLTKMQCFQSLRIFVKISKCSQKLKFIVKYKFKFDYHECKFHHVIDI